MDQNNIIKIESEVVLDCLDFDILVVSADLRILFANKSFLKKEGLKAGDVVGRHCYEISHHLNSPCQPPLDPCPIEEVKTTGLPAVKIHTHQTKNNQALKVNVIATPIEEHGQKIGFLHISLPVREGADNAANTKEALEKTLDVLRVIRLYQEQVEQIREKTKSLEETKTELEGKIEELERFTKAAVGREMRMIELKQKIKNLEKNF